MKHAMKRYLGFDCGNSSIRTVVGSFDGEQLVLEVIAQVPNREYRGIGYDHWDILAIFHELLKGMKTACDTYPDIESFGISTWGIDFGLLGPSGELLGNPLCYRNRHGGEGMKGLSSEELDTLFNATGIQNLPMNTLYQLLGIRELLSEYYEHATSLLLTPDLLNYMLTGERNSEVSIASTTELIDMRSRTYAETVFSTTNLRRDLYAPLLPHKAVRGVLKQELAELYHIPRLKAISVPSHDTAAAVLSVPTEDEHVAFISSGTWSLIGTELSDPLINETVQRLGFSNEGGALDTITLLKNSCGMHILQNIKRELEFKENRKYAWDEIVELSRPGLSIPTLPTFDVNHESLYNPASMIRAVSELTGIEEIGDIIASSYRSLALSYGDTIKDLEDITGKHYDTIHIIGGGARNDHVNQMTADLTLKRVVSGPEEATSLGIIAMQILRDFPHYTVADLRAIIRDSVPLGVFTPKE